jgi:excisionase family DNA binding protein
MSERLLTLPQACDQLACSLATLKRRIRTGQLPVFRDGRLIRIRQTDLDHYIHQHIARPAQAHTPTTAAPSASLPAGRRLFELPDPLT